MQLKTLPHPPRLPPLTGHRPDPRFDPEGPSSPCLPPCPISALGSQRPAFTGSNSPCRLPQGLCSQGSLSWKRTPAVHPPLRVPVAQPLELSSEVTSSGDFLGPLETGHEPRQRSPSPRVLLHGPPSSREGGQCPRLRSCVPQSCVRTTAPQRRAGTQLVLNQCLPHTRCSLGVEVPAACRQGCAFAGSSSTLRSRL